MNQDLVTSNSLLYNIANDRQLLSSGGKLNMIPVIRKNQTTVTLENYFYFSFSSKYRASMVGLGNLEEFRC